MNYKEILFSEKHGLLIIVTNAEICKKNYTENVTFQAHVGNIECALDVLNKIGINIKISDIIIY